MRWCFTLTFTWIFPSNSTIKGNFAWKTTKKKESRIFCAKLGFSLTLSCPIPLIGPEMTIVFSTYFHPPQLPFLSDHLDISIGDLDLIAFEKKSRIVGGKKGLLSCTPCFPLELLKIGSLLAGWTVPDKRSFCAKAANLAKVMKAVRPKKCLQSFNFIVWNS